MYAVSTGNKLIYPLGYQPLRMEYTDDIPVH